MSRISLFCFLIMQFVSLNNVLGICQAESASFIDGLSSHDTIPDNQTLYNGRYWHNLYSSVRDNRFLFSTDFLPGSVTMMGKTFPDIMLKYDIFKDEILTPFNPGGIVQLNKEMVDSFSIQFQNKKYHFTNISDDDRSVLSGYCNVLYKGPHALYVKYSKKIGKLAEEGRYDKFYQIDRIYLFKNDVPYPVSGKNDFLKLLRKEKTSIRDFLRNNDLTISRVDPETFIPVLRYLDGLK